jgi:hypothetical protein
MALTGPVGLDHVLWIVLNFGICELSSSCTRKQLVGLCYIEARFFLIDTEANMIEALLEQIYVSKTINVKLYLYCPFQCHFSIYKKWITEQNWRNCCNDQFEIDATIRKAADLWQFSAAMFLAALALTKIVLEGFLAVQSTIYKIQDS